LDKDNNRLLKVEDLQVDFYPGDPGRCFSAVCAANFSVDTEEVVGLVGESGCGKSVSALALPALLPSHARATGQISFESRPYELPDPRQDQLRGRRIGMIFQEPASALNPVFTVRSQLEETLLHWHDYEEKSAAAGEAVELLGRVHLDNPAEKLDKYPHQLSGGQCQRVMIALALAAGPRLLIADEPTTALDASLRREIIELLGELAGEQRGVLLISHDLNLISSVVDRVVIMYSGYTVETGPSGRIMKEPLHPYTRGLIQSSTAIYSDEERLPVIPGEVPEPVDRPAGCPFHPRCSEAVAECLSEFPAEEKMAPDWLVSCWQRGAGKNAP